MNLQEQFYQAMTNSRAASTPDARVTEMGNGLLVSKPAKKEPEVIDLQEYAKSRKAGSVSNQDINVNKVRAIHNFINSNGRI
jgi:anti-sigma28 factor (negative regulator of flagellin synthesis)